MKHIISYSGGMGSFAEANLSVQLYGKDNVIAWFLDTNMEDEDLYRFLNETIDFLGIELRIIKDGRTPFEVFKDEKIFGRSGFDPCSRILKRQLFKDTLKLTYPNPKKVIVHVGIDYSEEHRMDAVYNSSHPYNYISILIENGLIIKKDYSEQFGIKKPRLYDWGLGHNNCGGFCPKAGIGHYKKLFEANPERYIKFEQLEQEVRDVLPQSYKFLKTQKNKVITRYTLKELREQVLEKDLISDDDKNSFGGCGCMI